MTIYIYIHIYIYIYVSDKLEDDFQNILYHDITMTWISFEKWFLGTRFDWNKKICHLCHSSEPIILCSECGGALWNQHRQPTPITWASILMLFNQVVSLTNNNTFTPISINIILNVSPVSEYEYDLTLHQLCRLFHLELPPPSPPWTYKIHP